MKITMNSSRGVRTGAVALCYLLTAAPLQLVGQPTITPPATNNPPSTNPPSLALGPSISQYFDVEVGMAVLRPFSITASTARPGKFSFDAGGTDVRGMVQGIFQDRWAWKIKNTAPTENVWIWEDFSADFEARLGYAYGSSGSQSSSTTGSGDGFGEASVGFNLLKIGQKDPNSPLIALNIEPFAGFVSDSEYSILHIAYGIGPALALGVPLPNSRPNLELLLRTGWARVDSPVFIAPNLVDSDGDGNPRFESKNAAAITAEIRLPVLVLKSSQTAGSDTPQYGYLAFGADYYKLAGNGPDQWSLYAAFSVSWEAILDLIPTPSFAK